MKSLYASTCLILCASCSTTSESLQLGGVTGALVGAAAVAAGHAGASEKIKGKSIVIGAEIGSLLGLVMGFAIHRAVENHRRLEAEEQTEMHFGDLPPSPFVVPKAKINFGGR